MSKIDQFSRCIQFVFRGNARVDAGKKAREPRGMDAVKGQFRCARPEVFRSGPLVARLQTNSQKEPRYGLKFMNAPAEKGSIGFEENKMTAPGDGANKMGDAGMMQRFASPDPNDRGAAANNLSDLFVRNRMVGIVMQNFRRIQELDGAHFSRQTEHLRNAGHGEVRSKPQGKPDHAL